MNDPLGAFCRHTHVTHIGSETGPLAGLSFAVKDVFHIKGHRTGAGNPDWLRTHPVAETTAPVVQRLLDAGAHIVGKTHTDELTYSLNGENVHYGTPVNPNAAGRIPGGSSSGSAAAAAGGLVDFAIGTDCGGSVRLPASYCGIFGFAFSVPLASSFDTVGWFTCNAGSWKRSVVCGRSERRPAATPTWPQTHLLWQPNRSNPQSQRSAKPLVQPSLSPSILRASRNGCGFSVSFKVRRSGLITALGFERFSPLSGRVFMNVSSGQPQFSKPRWTAPRKNENRLQLEWMRSSERIASCVSLPHPALPRFGTDLRMSWRRFGLRR